MVKGWKGSKVSRDLKTHVEQDVKRAIACTNYADVNSSHPLVKCLKRRLLVLEGYARYLSGFLVTVLNSPDVVVRIPQNGPMLAIKDREVYDFAIALPDAVAPADPGAECTSLGGGSGSACSPRTPLPRSSSSRFAESKLKGSVPKQLDLDGESERKYVKDYSEVKALVSSL